MISVQNVLLRKMSESSSVNYSKLHEGNNNTQHEQAEPELKEESLEEKSQEVEQEVEQKHKRPHHH